MMERLVRIGRVSSIDYARGMVAVTYPQYDDATTAMLPFFSFTDEYKMPQIGDDVLVLHFGSGASAGIVLGPFWNRANTCPGAGPGIWRHELGQSPGEAFMTYDSASGTLTIHAAKIVIDGDMQTQNITAAGTVHADSVVSGNGGG